MKRLVLALGIVFAAALIVGGIDRRSALITAEHERAAAQKKGDLTPRERVWLRLPLECEQFLATRGAGEKWKVRTVCADLTKQAER